jgi:acetoacetate decarboxylase
MQAGYTDSRYDMPISFGPSAIGEKTIVEAADVAIAAFRADGEAARLLLPPRFELPERPAVTVAFIRYHALDYLGGRGYDEVIISIESVFNGDKQRIEAPFVLASWVNQIGALLTGREYQGFLKLLDELNLQEHQNDPHFMCKEYDSPLVEGRVVRENALPPHILEKINRSAREVTSMSWKHIPGVDGIPDANYPTKSVMRWHYDEAWNGSGQIAFHTPDLAEAPCSWRAVRALKDLPVVESLPAFVGRGSAVVDRSAMTRLY